jgi:GNAT superfamily N-acetyltransferase
MSQPVNAKLIELTDQNFFLVHSLLNESKINGYDFIQRMIDDWNTGENQFSKPGEKLWGLILAKDLIGLGGLNIDPYAEGSRIGRVRHLYIQETYRRKGYATLLMNAIINEGRQHFTALRLFTDNPAASEFYETLGFEKINGFKVSHILNF